MASTTAEFRPPFATFTAPLSALLAAMFGFVVGNAYGEPWIGFLIGGILGAIIAFAIDKLPFGRTQSRLGTIVILGLAGLTTGSAGGVVSGVLIGEIGRAHV